MTRKRSKYKPRAVLANPLCLLQPASKEKRDRVMLAFYSALEGMARGSNPDKEEWRALSDCINVFEQLAILGKVPLEQAGPMVNAAILAMVEAKNRFQAGQGMRLSGVGIQAIRDVIDAYGQCIEGLTEREIEIAQGESRRRLSEIMRSRPDDPTVAIL